MDLKSEWKKIAGIISVFLIFYFLPIGMNRFDSSVFEALYLVKWYAREHVLLCLVPAFFIAGAVGVFISNNSVIKYLGAKANKVIAYGVASVSGSILAVCSCTILPLFTGIYRMGAGLGPASAFLYSGPAINIMAIILTAKILGVELGIARAVGAILFSVLIGILMEFFFRNEKAEDPIAEMALLDDEETRKTWQTILYFVSMIGILVFANWGKPADTQGIWAAVYGLKWLITSGFGISLGLILWRWYQIDLWKISLIGLVCIIAAVMFPDKPVVSFSLGFAGLSIVTASGKGEVFRWFESSWDFAKQILPLLLIGVLIAGFLLGRVDHEGIIPSAWVEWALGGNSLKSNFFASFAGAFMYFATLTEVPIIQGLMGSGMGKGPALALLLAGPALSLPNMLVIRSVLGSKKNFVFVILVICMSTITGVLYGFLFG